VWRRLPAVDCGESSSAGSVDPARRTPAVSSARSAAARPRCSLVGSLHRSSGRNPVRFAIRASIRGPISSS
jgi:hypothetical protein